MNSDAVRRRSSHSLAPAVADDLRVRRLVEVGRIEVAHCGMSIADTQPPM